MAGTSKQGRSYLNRGGSDNDLLRAVLSGQRDADEALELLLARYLARVHRFISSRVGNAQDVDDLAMTVLTRVWKSFDSFRGSTVEELNAWIFQIARNVVADHYRATLHQEALLARESGATRSGTEPDSLQQYELLEALDRLLPVERSALILSSAYGYSGREIQEALKSAGFNLTRSAIYNKISRARQKLSPSIGTGSSVAASSTDDWLLALTERILSDSSICLDLPRRFFNRWLNDPDVARLYRAYPVARLPNLRTGVTRDLCRLFEGRLYEWLKERNSELDYVQDVRLPGQGDWQSLVDSSINGYYRQFIKELLEHLESHER